MAENWAADVKKYVPNANEKAIAGIVKCCGIALQRRDSIGLLHGQGGGCARAQQFPEEKTRGLATSDAELDKAIMLVGDKMQGDRSKNRVTVYYLLADH